MIFKHFDSFVVNTCSHVTMAMLMSLEYYIAIVLFQGTDVTFTNFKSINFMFLYGFLCQLLNFEKHPRSLCINYV